MKNLLEKKWAIYTFLFTAMILIYGAVWVQNYYIEIGTTLSAGTLLSTMFANGGIIPWIKNDKFVALTDAAAQQLDVEQLSEYHKALLEEKDKKLKELIESKASAEEVQGFKDEITAIKDEVTVLKEASDNTAITKSLEDLETKMQDQIDEAGVAITKLKDGGLPGTSKSLKEIIKKALEHEYITEFMARGEKGASKGVKLDVKDVTMVGFTNDVVAPNRRGPQVSYLGPKKFDIRDHLSGGTSDVDVIDHLKETGFVDNGGFLAENAETAESTLNLEQVKTTSVRLGTHIDVSKKALRNVGFLTNHLSNRFEEQLGQTLTDSIINGTGAANTIDGLFNNAATFTAGSLAGTVDSANTADTISAAICRLQEITNLMATAILMNPKDVYGMKVTKDTSGDYVESEVIVTRINGQLFIDAVPVFSTFHVAADTYLVGDLSATAVEWYVTDDLTMSISEHHDKNFIKNLVTFNFEIEGLLPIYKTFAFLKGTISTDKAAIDSGS